tara:strand:- start:957 stop:1940 length:984 start_codon:yes stop_codon:yes gene_type:complete
MSHEITTTDGAVFHKNKAWHGLGYVIQDEMSPLGAVEKAGLDWYVYKTDGVFGYTSNGVTVMDSDRCMTYREDTKEALGYVSSDYNIFQNVELAELAYSVSDDVKVESAFSMMGGKRVVILLKGSSIEVGKEERDVLDTYFCLCNGHDGKFSLRGFGTSIRIVCQNTLQMALSNAKGQTYSISHNGDFQTKLADMRTALGEYKKNREWFYTTVNSLAQKDVTHDRLNEFWRQAFTMVTDPKILKNETAAVKEATRFMESVKITFENEREIDGIRPSMWLAANAVTSDVQHKISTRGRKASYENRAGEMLMGKKAETSNKIMKAALAF